MTDEELYARYLAGEMSAGDQLMLRHGDALTAYLAAFLHNDQDAEDLMLDCFSVILVRKPKIREGCFRAYLFRTARNMANRLWKQRFRRQEFSLNESLAAPGGTPEDTAWSKDRSVILQRCLNRIAPQYREALYLVYDQELTYRQAAEIMGCGTKRIEDLLRNGKKRLQAELEREGITHGDL